MSTLRIAVIDSGKGGRYLFDKLVEHFPDIQFFCETDEENVPYGEKKPQQLLELGSALVRRAAQHQPDLIIVACHTLCSWCLQELQQMSSVPLWSVNELLLEELLNIPARDKVTLWATSKTIESQWFEAKLHQARPDLGIQSLACPGLATAIEEQDDAQIESLLHQFVQETHGSVLALACTHYPVIRDKIGRYYSGKILDTHSSLLAHIAALSSSISQTSESAL